VGGKNSKSRIKQTGPGKPARVKVPVGFEKVRKEWPLRTYSRDEKGAFQNVAMNLGTQVKEWNGKRSANLGRILCWNGPRREGTTKSKVENCCGKKTHDNSMKLHSGSLKTGHKGNTVAIVPRGT